MLRWSPGFHSLCASVRVSWCPALNPSNEPMACYLDCVIEALPLAARADASFTWGVCSTSDDLNYLFLFSTFPYNIDNAGLFWSCWPWARLVFTLTACCLRAWKRVFALTSLNTPSHSSIILCYMDAITPNRYTQTISSWHRGLVLFQKNARYRKSNAR